MNDIIVRLMKNRVGGRGSRLADVRCLICFFPLIYAGPHYPRALPPVPLVGIDRKYVLE